MMQQVSRSKINMQQVPQTKNQQTSSFTNKISFPSRKIKVKISQRKKIKMQQVSRIKIRMQQAL